ALAAAVPAAGAPRPVVELPRGGVSVLPEHRVVAIAGAPQADALGILGIGPPAQARRALARLAAPFDGPGGRPVLPAMELITVVAQPTPGRSGLYRLRQHPDVVRRYLQEARRARALLILDVQPGRADFPREVRALAPFLREPEVGVALDPEWRMGAGQVPGRTLGSVDALEVNRVSAFLSRVVAAHGLPDKVLMVHQFTGSMIRRRELLRPYPGVDLVITADGIGTPAAKRVTYERLMRGTNRLHRGFKLFFEEDRGLMPPGAVLRMDPPPDLVVYE
ncbi:MAG TPA: hypothetical protein VNT51_10920, partial [Miltoncostaeaceae bacterium]|nr:hypothetical protein [Miltoncostaeaceae bacterium]